MPPVSNQPRDIPSDRQLVDQVLGGNTHIFGTIIKNTEGLVAQIVFRLIPGEEDRKAIVQDIYLKVFHHLHRFKFESKLSTWIARIAYNTCISWLQKKKLPVLADPGDEEDNVSGHVTGETDRFLIVKELSVILRAEIDTLPPLYQMLVSLCHQEELTYDEMAQVMDMRVGTVKSYLF